MDKGAFTAATAIWAEIEEAVGNMTDNVDWYNALLHNVDDESAAASWLKGCQQGMPCPVPFTVLSSPSPKRFPCKLSPDSLHHPQSALDKATGDTSEQLSCC